MPKSDFEKFQEICRRISLNIPQKNQWRWDDKFGTALVTFEKIDMELIYFPISLEFSHQWDFISIDQADGPFFAHFVDRFGLVPGQKIFTTENGAGIVLFATWWPWGDDTHFSLRVGLFAQDANDLTPKEIRAQLTDWFNLQISGPPGSESHRNA